MRALIPLSLILAVFDICPVYGLGVPFQIRAHGPAGQLVRRASPINISNTGNAQYISNITLGGVTVRVLLDTGSSDLWVNFPDQTPVAKDLGKSVTLAYAVGKAGGNVHTTQLQFGNHTVEDQAFLFVTNTSTFSANIHTQGYDGLLGLGPNKGSVIRDKIDSSVGDTVLTRIFEQRKTSENYISFLLDRKNDPTAPFTGQLTISEIIPGFENITTMPKLDVETVYKLLQQDQHWQALTDKDNGIIGPDGQIIKISSMVPKAPDGQLVAVFDSGFTFSQVPREVSDAIYGRVQGAVYDTKQEYWTVPCGQMLNLTFNFGGHPYPVHPLDVVDDNFNKVDINGNKICIGAFQPITSAFSLLGHYDMIMGMSFLRNAYTLLDFGNWIGGQSKDHPYIQLASVTDPAVARDDFITTRLGGIDTTGDSKWTLLPQSQIQHSPVSEEEKKKKYEAMVLSRWPYILVGCLAFVIIVLGLCIWKCCCRKGKKGTKSKKGLFSSKEESTAYLPLQEQNRGVSPGFIPPPQYTRSDSRFSQHSDGGQIPQYSQYGGYGNGGHHS